MIRHSKDGYCISLPFEYFGTFQTEGEAKMRLAQVLEEAFDGQDVEPSAVRQMIEDAIHNGYHHFRERGKVTSWYMIERD